MQGYAVIDFETTGLFPGGHDRVIEVAVVHVDAAGRVTGLWDTLVNPDRDLGKQAIHGVQASDVMLAPTFAQIAPELCELLAGRVVVAHNASFDTRFLTAELARIGVEIELAGLSLCTMQLARHYLPGAGRSLADCTAALGITLENAHRASADAFATAELLGAYIQMDPLCEDWLDAIERADAAEWPRLAPSGFSFTPRPAAGSRTESFLARITEHIPEFAGPAAELDYLALLDRCLVDRVISSHEGAALVSAANDLGLARADCERLHHEYFEQLTALAWADGVLTDNEAADLLQVADLLEVPTDRVTSAISTPTTDAETDRLLFALATGDLVVLTGDMSTPRDEWHSLLEMRGFVPWRAVTKKVKVVVAADVDSLSGKAKKARDYGIPVVTEAWLGEQLGVAGHR